MSQLPPLSLPLPPLLQPLPLLRRSVRQRQPRAPSFEQQFYTIYGTDHRMQDDDGGEEEEHDEMNDSEISVADSRSACSSDHSWADGESESESSEDERDECTESEASLTGTDDTSVSSE